MPYPDQISDAQMAEIRRRLGVDNGRVVDNPPGESVYDRSVSVNSSAWASQQLRFAGFTALNTQNITQIKVSTGGTAAGATPSLCRFGVYLRSGPVTAASYTLIASTTNDTALFGAANTTNTKSFDANWLKVAGEDYLVAILIVSAAAMPTFVAPAVGGSAGFQTDFHGPTPMVCGFITGQADLPSTFLESTITKGGTGTFHALLLQ